MEELKKQIDNKNLIYTESEKRLYLLLIGKKEGEITPKLVSEAMSSLQQEPECNLS